MAAQVVPSRGLHGASGGNVRKAIASWRTGYRGAAGYVIEDKLDPGGR
ncbi:MAG: hypothetical protein AAGF32_10240 [Pseudomonadota bacterium]